MVNVDFGYVDGKELGRHVQKYTLSACFDYDCTWHLEGSPLEIEVIYEITMFPDSIEEVEADTRIENDYNIVDAEYSDKLDVVVIASSEPDNALYVYDLADKTEHKIPLNVTPTSVSVANAGNSNKVAVGHDAYVTWVELKEDALSQSSSKMLTATTDIFDLTATEDAVYAVSDNYSWEGLHRIDVMDNSTTVSNSSGQSRIKLHPGLKSVYLTDNGSSSYGLEKVDITSVPPSVSADSPYYGDYPVCGDLWISNKGDRIYTACGNTFRSSDDISVDMTYSGRISTTQIDDYGVARIQSLAESPSSNEIVLIEDGAMYGDSCNAEYYLSGRCFYFLGLYTKDYMNNVERLGFTGNEVEGVSYYDKPEFVFYDESGEDIVVIGNIIGSETPKSAIRTISRN